MQITQPRIKNNLFIITLSAAPQNATGEDSVNMPLKRVFSRTEIMHLTCTLVQEVGEQAAHDSLMTDDQHIALALQLHDDWLQALNQILVGLERG